MTFIHVFRELPVNIIHGSRPTVHDLQGYFLGGGDLIGERDSGHEIEEHIIDHVAVLVNFNRIQIIFEPPVCCRLFPDGGDKLISQAYGDHGIIDGGGKVIQCVGRVTAVQALTPTVRKPVIDVPPGLLIEAGSF